MATEQTTDIPSTGVLNTGNLPSGPLNNASNTGPINTGPLAAPSTRDQAQSVLGVIGNIDERVRMGDLGDFRPISTGFEELDIAITGGLRIGQLALVSGPAGVGKTTLLLQMARNIAASNRGTCLFLCYEHETDYLAQRLISMESVLTGDGSLRDGLRLRDIGDLVSRTADRQYGKPGFLSALRGDPRGQRALERIAQYGQRLILMKGSTYATTVDVITNTVREVQAQAAATNGGPVVLFVDYLQKIPTESSHVAEAARNFEEIEGLKEMALSEGIVVVVISAAEVEGLKAQRMRLQHLLTSAAIAYEADMVILMNEKYDVIDRRHVEYNPYNAEQYHQYVVLSIEKNRSGSDLIDIEIKKQLQFCRFYPDSRRVEESLISGRVRE